MSVPTTELVGGIMIGLYVIGREAVPRIIKKVRGNGESDIVDWKSHNDECDRRLKLIHKQLDLIIDHMMNGSKKKL